MMHSQHTESETLKLSVTPKAGQVLGLAAKAADRSVSEFVLEALLARAGDLLPDRRHFGLDAGQWEAFTAALDVSPRDLRRFKRPLENPGAFE